MKSCIMKKLKLNLNLAALSILLGSSFVQPVIAGSHDHGGADKHQEEEVVKGPNNGRMLVDGDFAIELQLFENGLPPEFRVFATQSGQKLPANEVDVSMQLVRLGNQIDDIKFNSQGAFLRGDTVVYEPHSFVVKLQAKYQGKTYQWQYDNFVGRTLITDAMAEEMAIATSVVSEQAMKSTTPVYGQLVLPENSMRHIKARYPGKVTKLHVQKGQSVTKGQALMQVESNDSLQSYTVYAPIAGIVSEQTIAAGEQAGDDVLLTLIDMSELHAELKVFPSKLRQIKLGAEVQIKVEGLDQTVIGTIWDKLTFVDAQQARTYRVKLDNRELDLLPGQFVQADVVVDEFVAPLAVKSSGLQAFRDFTVVYAKIGEEYEVRMLELGRKAGDWVEVLSGIKAGTEYVTENSYIIKADIEKSGASHDH